MLKLNKDITVEKVARACDDLDNGSIENVDNHIYFYSDVTKDKVLELNKAILELEKKLLALMYSYKLSEFPNINIHINSPGGYLLDALSAVEYIVNCRVPVVTIVEGSAASAATIISVVAHKRLMGEHSYMLIHQLQSVCWGKYNELKEEMKNLDLFMQMIKKIYKRHTKIPAKKIDNILSHDLFFDADECLKYGLVDEIVRAK